MKKLHMAQRFATFVALASLIPTESSAVTEYNIYSIPNLNGGTFSTAYGLNNWGNVVGIIDIPGGKVRGYFFDGTMTLIAPDNGGNHSRAFDVNDTKVVAGYRERFDAASNMMRTSAYAWNVNSSVITSIGNFGGTANFESSATAINNQNAVVGSANGMQGSVASNPLSWSESSGIQWIGTQTGLPTSYGYATGISDNGHICGYGEDATGLVRPFKAVNGVVSYLTSYANMPGSYFDTWMRDINNNAKMTGEYRLASGVYRALRHSSMGYVAMGKLNGSGADVNDSSSGYGINKPGDIVGYSEIGNLNYRAFVAPASTNNAMVDLNSYLPAGSAWVLKFAYDINDYGVICGIGTLNGQQRGFVMRPVAPIFGKVTLRDWQPSLDGRIVTFEIYEDPTGKLLETKSVVLGPDGTYELNTDKTGPSRRISLKDSHWLRGTRVINLNTNGWTGIDFNLVNGDADGDNEVNLVDYALVSSSFGKSVGDVGFNAAADLDGDGEVTLSDLSIVGANFGQIGSE